MVVVVVCMNLMIALALLILTGWVWQLQYRLAQTTLVLIRAERSTHRVLRTAPYAIRQGQLGIHDLHRDLRQLERNLGQVQQVFTVLGFGLSFVRRRSNRRQRPVRDSLTPE